MILHFYVLPKTSDVARAGRALYEPCFVRYKKSLFGCTITFRTSCHDYCPSATIFYANDRFVPHGRPVQSSA